MTPRARRALFTLVLFFAVCAVAGTVLQRKVGAQSSEDESQIRDSLKAFTDVYALVEQNYAEPIQGTRPISRSTMAPSRACCACSTRTPISTTRRRTRRLREDQRGHYYGVGMVIQQQNNKVYVDHALRGHSLVSRRHSARGHHQRRRRQVGRRHDLRPGGQGPERP